MIKSQVKIGLITSYLDLRNIANDCGKWMKIRILRSSALQERGKREARLTKTCAGISVCHRVRK